MRVVQREPLKSVMDFRACTNSTQDECFRRKLFGNNKVGGWVAMKVKKGDFFISPNLDTDILFGVFRARNRLYFKLAKRSLEREILHIRWKLNLLGKSLH